MPTSVARSVILRELCEMIEGAGDVDVLRTTDSGGSPTTLVDSLLADADGDTDTIGRPWLRIDELVGSGPAAGKVTRVRKAGFTIADGTLTVSPSLVQTVESGTDFSFWRIIHPATVLSILNSVLRDLRRETIVPVTVLDSRLATDGDGDMEVSGTSSWAGTNATLSKITTAPNVRHGAQSLRVQGSGGAPVAQSQSVPAIEGQVWLAGVAVRVDTGSCGLQPYDVTAGADIGSVVTANEEAYQWLEPDFFTIPANCEEIALRLEGAGASDDFYADDMVLWPTLQREYELPSWIEDPRDLLAIGHFGRGHQYNTQNVYTPGEREFVPWGYQRSPEMIEEGGSHPFRIFLDTPVTYPLYMLAWRPAATLTSDTATTTVPRTLLVRLTAQRVFAFLYEQAIRNGNGDEAAQWLTQVQLSGAAAQGFLGGYRFGKRKASVRGSEFVGYSGS